MTHTHSHKIQVVCYRILHVVYFNNTTLWKTEAHFEAFEFLGLEYGKQQIRIKMISLNINHS